MKRVYLDHNASAPLRAEAREAMIAAMDVMGIQPDAIASAKGLTSGYMPLGNMTQMTDEERQMVIDWLSQR